MEIGVTFEMIDKLDSKLDNAYYENKITFEQWDPTVKLINEAALCQVYEKNKLDKIYTKYLKLIKEYAIS